jgi:hypothetical protein
MVKSACLMEKMDDLQAEITRLFAAKERRRRALATLRFAEKVRIVVQMQKMVQPILRARGHAARIGPLD